MNPELGSAFWSATDSESATPATQPMRPDSNVIPIERRTPSIRPAIHATTSVPGRVSAKTQGHSLGTSRARTMIRASCPPRQPACSTRYSTAWSTVSSPAS